MIKERLKSDTYRVARSSSSLQVQASEGGVIHFDRLLLVFDDSDKVIEWPLCGPTRLSQIVRGFYWARQPFHRGPGSFFLLTIKTILLLQ